MSITRRPLRPNHLKEYNRLNVLQAIRRKSCSRAEISASLGLSKPTVSILVEDLLKEGIIRECGQGKSTASGGKKPILLNFNHDAGLIAVVYINGHVHECEIALTNLEPAVRCSGTFPFHQDESWDVTLDRILEHLKALIQTYRETGSVTPVTACCVSISGLVDNEEGVVRYTATLSGWRDVPVKQRFEEELHIPVMVENDGRAGAMAELLTRNWDVRRILACVNVGRGIGTGIVIGNEVFRGSYSGAVTFSHTTIWPDGPLCSCGNRGCFESLASLHAFTKELERHGGLYRDMEPEAAIRLYLEGDPVVKDVLFHHTGYWLSIGLANLLNTFNPEELIIQGPLSLAGRELLDHIRELTLQRTLPVSRQTSIRFSSYDAHIPIYGAAAVFIARSFFHYGIIENN